MCRPELPACRITRHRLERRQQLRRHPKTLPTPAALRAIREIALHRVNIKVIDSHPLRAKGQLPARQPAAVQVCLNLLDRQRHRVRPPAHVAGAVVLVEPPRVRRNLDGDQGQAVERRLAHACLAERDRRLDHARRPQHHIVGQAGVADADDRPRRVLDTEDDDAARTVVGHPAHALGDVGGAGGAAFELHRRRLAAGDELAQGCFVHGDTCGQGHIPADTIAQHRCLSSQRRDKPLADDDFNYA